MAVAARRGGDGDVEQVHLAGAAHRHAVGEQLAAAAVEGPGHVAGGERIDEVAAGPGEGVDLGLERDHALERGQGHRPEGVAGDDARRWPRVGAHRCTRPAAGPPSGTGDPSERPCGVAHGVVAAAAARRFALARRLRHLVADVERQGLGRVDAGAIAPGTPVRARSESASARASGSEVPCRYRGDRRKRAGRRRQPPRAGLAPAPLELGAVEQHRRRERRPAAVGEAVLARRRSGSCAHRSPPRRERSPRRRAPPRRRRAGCRSAAPACRRPKRQAPGHRAGGAQAGEGARAAAEGDRVEIGAGPVRLPRAGPDRRHQRAPKPCCRRRQLLTQRRSPAARATRHALAGGVECEQDRHATRV